MVKKFLIGFFILVLFSLICSCAQKRYYPKKQRPRGKCGCGGFSHVLPQNQIDKFQYESSNIC